MSVSAGYTASEEELVKQISQIGVEAASVVIATMAAAVTIVPTQHASSIGLMRSSRAT